MIDPSGKIAELVNLLKKMSERTGNTQLSKVLSDYEISEKDFYRGFLDLVNSSNNERLKVLLQQCERLTLFAEQLSYGYESAQTHYVEDSGIGERECQPMDQLNELESAGPDLARTEADVLFNSSYQEYHEMDSDADDVAQAITLSLSEEHNRLMSAPSNLSVNAERRSETKDDARSPKYLLEQIQNSGNQALFNHILCYAEHNFITPLTRLFVDTRTCNGGTLNAVLRHGLWTNNERLVLLVNLKKADHNICSAIMKMTQLQNSAGLHTTSEYNIYMKEIQKLAICAKSAMVRVGIRDRDPELAMWRAENEERLVTLAEAELRQPLNKDDVYLVNYKKTLDKWARATKRENLRSLLKTVPVVGSCEVLDRLETFATEDKCFQYLVQQEKVLRYEMYEHLLNYANASQNAALIEYLETHRRMNTYSFALLNNFARSSLDIPLMNMLSQLNMKMVKMPKTLLHETGPDSEEDVDLDVQLALESRNDKEVWNKLWSEACRRKEGVLKQLLVQIVQKQLSIFPRLMYVARENKDRWLERFVEGLNCELNGENVDVGTPSIITPFCVSPHQSGDLMYTERKKALETSLVNQYLSLSNTTH